MMTDKRSNIDPLSGIMRKSRLEMPFSDFDETVMQRIRKGAIQKQTASREYKLSFIFFLLGIVSGLTAYAFLQKAQYSFFDIPPETIVLIFQIGFVVVFLIQFEKNLHMLDRWRKRIRA